MKMPWSKSEKSGSEIGKTSVRDTEVWGQAVRKTCKGLLEAKKSW